MSRPARWFAALAAMLAATLCAHAQTGFGGFRPDVCAAPTPEIAGARALHHPSLVVRANGAPGAGGLCGGRAFVLQQPLTVYRVWDSSAPGSKFGQWWALEPPAGTREAYRSKYVMCPTRNRMDRISSCTLTRGTIVVVGTGQSMNCQPAGPRLPQSPVVQVFMPKESAGFAACLTESWP